jgi:hypothetical protein
MTPITPRQKSLIVNSFRRTFRADSIDLLTAPAYRYISLAGGFIAHYNLQGFRDAYRDIDALKRDIQSNASINSWKNFSPGDKDYDYYKSKAEVYRAILALT